MPSLLKRIKSTSFRSLLVLGILLISFGVIAISTYINRQRTSLDSRAAGSNTVKIMTFNVLGGDDSKLCASSRNHRAEMQQITNFIRNNDIKVTALQEVKRISEDDGCEVDLPGIIEDQTSSPYQTSKRHYIGSDDFKWYRMFITNSAPVSYHKTEPDIDPGRYQGAESVVMDTPLGRIRFINIHPQPGQQALNVDKMLIPYIEQFKGDGIPMVLMGDFNLRYDFSDANPVMSRIESAGFYRACDPDKFANGNCNDTVRSSSVFAVDHILIDKRAQFIVKNAYVEQSMQFSDHLPVVVELAPPTATNPPPTKKPTNPPPTQPPQQNPTAFINIQARNPQGQAVNVRAMTYTYECIGSSICYSSVRENTSSASVTAYGGWKGGAGIVLNSNQRLLGVTPSVGGGSRSTRNGTSSNTTPWFNHTSTTWNNYWWSSYPTTGNRSVNFIVATVTPIPTNTPSPTKIPTATPRPTNTSIPLPTRTPTRTPTPSNNIGIPSLTSPANRATFKPGNVNIQWTTAANATSYEWNVYRGGNSPFKTGTTTGTTATVTSLPPGSYKWQVTARGASGTKNSAFGEFLIPFSKIKPLANSQIQYGSTYSFEWTPLLQFDMSRLYFLIYSSTDSVNPIYYRDIATTSTEYTSGRVTLALNSSTDPDFALGRSYTWQLVASRAGAASEHHPPNDNTSSPQSFSLVAQAPTATKVPPTATKAPPTATQIVNQCPRKAEGDANCDNVVDYVDFVCWRGELVGSKPSNCVSADFNGSGGKPNSQDYTIWFTTLKKEHNLQ